MKFNFDMFTEADFNDYCSRIKDGLMEVDWWVGNVRTGMLCFDLVTRCYEPGELTLTYDLYIGGVDTGYGYTSEGYPYDFGDGGSFPDFIGMTYEDFKQMAEGILTDYITANGYTEEAEKPLLLW